MKKNNKPANNNALNNQEDVQKTKDPHIDQDFRGYPNAHASENIINPKTKEDRLTAKTEKPIKTNLDEKLRTGKSRHKPEATTGSEEAVGLGIDDNKINYGQPNHVKKVTKQKKD